MDRETEDFMSDFKMQVAFLPHFDGFLTSMWRICMLQTSLILLSRVGDVMC